MWGGAAPRARPPTVSTTANTSFILGMGRVGEQVKTLLDLDKVLRQDELVDIMAEAGKESPDP